jgi:hypothetical protein
MQAQVSIQAHNLISFLEQFQEQVQAGYVMDLESNERYPQQIGVLYTATLVLASSEQQEDTKIGDDTDETVKSDVEPKKVGRKPKA